MGRDGGAKSKLMSSKSWPDPITNHNTPLSATDLSNQIDMNLEVVSKALTADEVRARSVRVPRACPVTLTLVAPSNPASVTST